MEDRQLEQIITAAMQIGVYNTLNELGLLNDVLTQQQAYKKHTQRIIDDLRHKGWITGYPTGNPKRGKVYFKRSEVETALRMLDIQNLVTENKIFKSIIQ